MMIADNSSWSSSADEAELCTLLPDVTAAAAAADCDDVTVTSSFTVQAAGHAGVLYVFVTAQLLVGLGGCGILVLSFPYIDENSPHTKSALYLGSLSTQPPPPATSDRFSTCLKLAFHDADTDTDTDILADILARIVARMSMSVSGSLSWNASFNKLLTHSFSHCLTVELPIVTAVVSYLVVTHARQP